ncbi:class I SAM-dependent methyltransferase [Actinoplanes teichomyceticus]|uniref:Methyltransferase family protein n=1 Tax=Actinoplanes teichomyceticus TaxID=1867 RepID=A0A561WLG6_ACTTI|nr:class I SAM-dependent methyltransferase [Actinoplanes teichomyceticus]TWG24706.1 methyltransferase family protein [Actinoplanes teichomyceticus]GIF14629.1 trans-aconitate methyltransferase [Actinoplanes teichomyceticus]
MTGEFSADWLALREPADADARSLELVGLLPQPVKVIRDLGCGTGSLGRWLAPRLPAPQLWILTDRDHELLEVAADRMPEGANVAIDERDVTALTRDDLTGADLVTCSALLDLLTAAEVDRLVEVCAQARTTALFTLSVTGQVRFTPQDPRDREVEAAFNAHQRRETGGRPLLGPDAPAYTAAAFTRAGARVVTRESPWRLGPQRARLTAEWLRGWVGAAAQQRPDLRFDEYLAARLAALPEVTVGHRDVLAIFE